MKDLEDSGCEKRILAYQWCHLPATASRGSSTLTRNMTVLQATYVIPAMIPITKAPFGWTALQPAHRDT